MFRCAAFDRGIKICRTLPLDFLCSAGFLDHRAILLTVMGLTKNAGSGIRNWCLLSMHLRPAYPLASLPCPLPPAPWVNPICLSPCPLITTASPGVLPGHWEVKQLGQGTVLFLLMVTPGIWLKIPHYIFMDEQIWCSLLLTMDDGNWLSLSALHKIICVYQRVTAFVCICSVTACTPISRLIGPDQLHDTHIYQSISGSCSWFPGGGWQRRT